MFSYPQSQRIYRGFQHGWLIVIYYQIGEVGKLEEVEEVRVETLCVGRDVAVKAVEALKK
jgi:hypothetical protein